MRFRFAIAAIVLFATVSPLSHGTLTGQVPPSASGLVGGTAAYPGRVELDLGTSDGVSVSLVTWRDPLPGSAPEHPAACDTISFLRYRPAFSPANASHADAVISAMPGWLSGASMFDPLARHTIRLLSAEHVDAQFWVINRRETCLEDRTGFVAALRERDYRIALDYYYRGMTVDGRTWAGFLPNSQQGVLAGIGLEQTLDDWHFINTHELPSPQARTHKLFLSGHSLGVTLATMYGAWDFGGSPASGGGPGYRQVAGFIGLDGPPTLNPAVLAASPELQSALGFGGGGLSMASIDELLAEGKLPRSLSTGTTSFGDAAYLSEMAGIAAEQAPAEESSIPASIPHSTVLDLMLSVLYSRDANHINNPDFRTWRMTNMAVLGSILDNNTLPTFFGIGMGTYSTPVIERHYPSLGSLGFGAGRPLMMPANPAGTLNGWLNYNQLAMAPAQLTDSGQPFTTPATEVSDDTEVARAVGSGEVGYWDCYFPERLLTDIAFAFTGVRSGDLTHLKYSDSQIQGVPHLEVISDLWAPYQSAGVIIPAAAIRATGYDHLDILSAAVRQNSGAPEVVTSSIARFVATELAALR